MNTNRFPYRHGIHGNSFDRDFDKKFNSGFKFVIVGVVCCWAIGLSILGFVGWVVYKLLQHNGVI